MRTNGKSRFKDFAILSKNWGKQDYRPWTEKL
jgi:hypothetical protein